MTGLAAGDSRDDRRQFLRERRWLLLWSGGTIGTLAGLAALFLAPNRLASVRLADVALAWWAAGAVVLGGLVALTRALRTTGSIGAPAATTRLAPLALALVFCSPAAWLGLPPLVFADGIRGLWAPLVTVGGTALALILGTTWGGPGGHSTAPSALVRSRWPGARSCHSVVSVTEAAVASLFVWAQLAAAREIGAMAGWPRATPIAVTLLVLGAVLLSDPMRIRLAGLGGGLALMGLALPFVAVTLGTTTAWQSVWGAVATRVRIAFGDGPWTREGGVVRGPGTMAVLRFADEQRVVVPDRGSVMVEPREGGRLARDVRAGEEIVLHPGDQLLVPGGLRLRFEPGRRVPGAPDSGPEWVEPASRGAGWLGLLALGMTGLLGAIGLPAGTASVGTGQRPRRGAGLNAVLPLVAAGVALAVGWSLYAVWMTPEVYVGGVGGAEVYALPASMPGLGTTGLLLAWLAFGALAVGGAAAVLAGLQAIRWGSDPVPARHLTFGLVATAGTLACVAPAGAWTLLLLALGLSASTVAPAAVLARGSRRATARGAMTGAAAGLATFLLLLVAGAMGASGRADGWWTAVVAGPAVVAAPVHLLVAWLLRARGLRARGLMSTRNPSPPGLQAFRMPPQPVRPPAG